MYQLADINIIFQPLCTSYVDHGHFFSLVRDELDSRYREYRRFSLSASDFLRRFSKELAKCARTRAIGYSWRAYIDTCKTQKGS